MSKIEANVEIKRPVERVFAYLTDVKSRPKWEPAMLEIEQTYGAEWAVGAKFRGINVVMGRRMPWTAELKEYEPNKNILMNIISEMSSIKERFSLDPVEGGTKLNIVYTLELCGFAKLIAPAVMGTLKKQVSENLVRLKGILEAQT